MGGCLQSGEAQRLHGRAELPQARRGGPYCTPREIDFAAIGGRIVLLPHMTTLRILMI